MIRYWKKFGSLLILALSVSLLPGLSKAQELDVTVELNTKSINANNVSYIKNLKPKLESYINKHDWLSDEFNKRERIKARFSIALRNYNPDNSRFTATLVITSNRPIYNTMQSTKLIQIKDNNWQFTYKEGSSLTHDLLQYSNIESVIDFYVYILFGYDYDSFGSLSGSEYFSEAQSIVDLAQTAGGSGWSRSGSNNRNRYFLINDLLSTGYEGLRKAMYRYHRYGLDKFIEKPEEARQEVIKALEMIQEAKRNTTNEYLFDLFFSAKYEELTAIFKDADTQVRLQAYNLLSEIDPGHTSTYGDLQ